MKIFSGLRIFIAIVITILVLIFISDQFSRIVWFGLVALAVYSIFRMLTWYDKLPARLAPLAKRAADKSPAISQTQQVSRTPPTPASARQTAPVERPDERAAPQEVEEWDDKQFNLDLRSRFVGQTAIDELEEEVTTYLDSPKKRPFICVIEGPEQAGKTELLSALGYAFGRQFSGNPEPILQGASLAIIDNDFIERQDVAIALLGPLGDKDFNEATIDSLKLFAHAQTSKLVFLSVRGKAPERLTALARCTIPIDKPTQAELCHMRFKRIFDEDHDIKLTISDSENTRLGNLLESLVSVEADNKAFRPNDINEQLRPRVAELVKTAPLFQRGKYTLKRVPKIPSNGKIQWEGFEFVEEAQNERRP